MTLSADDRLTLGEGTGVLTAFTYDFASAVDEEIAVEVDGVVVSSSTYTIDHNAKTVTFDTAPADGAVIAIYGDTTMLQEVDYSRTSYSLRLQQLEDQLDLLTKGVQEAKRELTFSPRFTYDTPAVLPLPAPETNKVLVGNAAADGYENKHATELGTLISGSFGESLLLTETALAARTLLQSAPIVDVRGSGADPTGAANSATAFSTAATLAGTLGAPLFIPPGTYLSGATPYEVGGPFLWLNDNFSTAVNVFAQARKTSLLLTGDTANTTPNDSTESRILLNATINAKGAQNGVGVRSNLYNWSTDTDGCVSFYAYAASADTAAWTSAHHGEIRHGGGTSIGGSYEIACYSASGVAYGLVINQSTSTAETTHPITGAAKALPATATAIYVQGDKTFGTGESAWRVGLDFASNSMRTDGYGIRFNGAMTSLIRSETGAVASTADIHLQAASARGIILSGAYTTGVALRINSGQYVALEATETVKFGWNGTAVTVSYGGAEKVAYAALSSSSPILRLNGTQVLTVQQGAIANPGAITAYSAPTVSAAYVQAEAQGVADELALLRNEVDALRTSLVAALAMLRTHGLIAT